MLRTGMGREVALRYGTPIEDVQVGQLLVRVKRDDQANNEDYLAPPLGKLRGLLKAIRASGTPTVVGGVDRRPSSRNSWATAYLCRELGLQAHVFAGETGPNQLRAIALGARFTLLPGLELEALYEAAAHEFTATYDPATSYLPVDDCQAEALVEDARQEVHRSDRDKLKADVVIVPTGSGGLAIGVLRGLAELRYRPHVVLHIGGSRRSEDYINGVLDGARLRHKFPSIRVVKERGLPSLPPPFPCNVTYERPAWDWMLEEFNSGSVLFWNAGA